MFNAGLNADLPEVSQDKGQRQNKYTANLEIFFTLSWPFKSIYNYN